MRRLPVARTVAICALLALCSAIVWSRAGSASSDGVTAIGAGARHTCAVTTEGGVLCWGNNYYGQLGDGTTRDRWLPVDVTGMSSGVVTVAAGLSHTCASTADGDVRCWGSNHFGRLGDGTTTSSSSPVDVAGLDGPATAVVAGEFHTCALTALGDVQCWGRNNLGQLGDGTTVSRAAPVNVSVTDGPVARIAAGANHTCALTPEGGVKCWGANDHGQLGDGTRRNRSVPVDVAGLAIGIASIAAGTDHTCAAANTGAVKCWGSNESKQLGRTHLWRDSSVPLDVLGLGNPITALAAGAAHTCGLTSQGGATCWGRNNDGQLGDGTRGSWSSPVVVAGVANVNALAAGHQHTCAVTTERTAYCWGSDTSGQLGTATLASSFVPISVDLKPGPDDECPDGKVAAGGDCATPTPDPRPGMTLAGPAVAAAGETFTLSVAADPAPDVPVSGLATEIALPTGVEWVPRANCMGPGRDGEIQIAQDDASPVPCVRDAGPAGEARHVVFTASAPPLPPLDAPLTELLEVDVRCAAPGAYTIELSAVPASSFGAAYATTEPLVLLVRTFLYDGIPVADVHEVACLDPDADGDGDGCTDIAEFGPDATLGGQRDPTNFWDFYDVPAAAGPSKDKAITGRDIFAVIARVGTEGDATMDPLSPADAGYHPAYDRGAVVGPNAWNVGPADGSIRGGDVFAMIAQFGHSCR